MQEKLVSCLCQRYSDARRLFDYFELKESNFPNEAKWSRLENDSSPREIMPDNGLKNGAQKTALQLSLLRKRLANTARKLISCKTTNHQKFVNEIS